MTRIIAGLARGRRLTVPPGDGTRPTADRAREALFSALDAELGGFAGLRVLDLFSGSGAIGLEALSRGAEHVLFVEADRRAARIIAKNVEAVRLPGAEVVVDRVERVLRYAPSEPYDLVVLDPPYAFPEAAVLDVLTALPANEWLADEATIVLERSSRDPVLGWPEGYEPARAKAYGEARLMSAVWYGRGATTD
jgi:16S rRNA (guanine966-N2)-methyltransferase